MASKSTQWCTLLKSARTASGVTIKNVADAADMSQKTWSERERNIGDFRVSELLTLKSMVNSDGRILFDEAIKSIFLDNN